MARKWTNEEVTLAIDTIKTYDPALWQRYIRGEIERNAIDMEDFSQMANLIRARQFPDFDIRSITHVIGLLRSEARMSLGLQWPLGTNSTYKPARPK